MARSDLEVPADKHRARRAIRVAPDPDPADRAATDREVRAGQHPLVPKDRPTLAPKGQHSLVPKDRPTLALKDRGPADPKDRGPADPKDRPAPAHGMGTPSTVTSTEHRGETAPHPGARARRHDPTGVGRFRHPADSG